MRPLGLIGAISVLLTSISCFSLSKYRSEILNITDLKPQLNGDFEVYEVKEPALQIALVYEFKKLYLKISNNSAAALTFLPLDLNLGTEQGRCSIKEIYEDFNFKFSRGKKVDFAKKYSIEKNTTKSFFYQFACERSQSFFLTINGLKQSDNKILLNFKFSKN